MVQEAKLWDSQHLSHWLLPLTVDLSWGSICDILVWCSFLPISVHRRGSTDSEGRRRGGRRSARSSLHILQLTLSFIGILKRMSGTRVYFFFLNFCFTAIPLQDFYHIHDASTGRQCSVTQPAIHKISGDLLSHPLEQTVKISTSFLF